jgi:hypothetical protein
VPRASAGLCQLPCPCPRYYTQPLLHSLFFLTPITLFFSFFLATTLTGRANDDCGAGGRRTPTRVHMVIVIVMM